MLNGSGVKLVGESFVILRISHELDRHKFPSALAVLNSEGFLFGIILDYFFYLWVGAGLGLPTPILIHEICQITNCYQMLQE